MDENSQTDIAGLYAIGETSYTGLHVQNRMAIFLLECFVYGMSAAKDIEDKFDHQFESPNVPEWVHHSRQFQMRMWSLTKLG